MEITANTWKRYGNDRTYYVGRLDNSSETDIPNSTSLREENRPKANGAGEPEWVKLGFRDNLTG
jgi:hypothetical protein